MDIKYDKYMQMQYITLRNLFIVFRTEKNKIKQN